MSACTAACEVKLPDGITLCHKHTGQLEAALQGVPEVWQDLQCTVARMDRAASSEGGRGAHQSSRPPVNLDAMDQAQTLRTILTGWASHLPTPPPTSTEPPQLSRTLLANLSTIRRTSWAPDLLDELHTAIREARYATDRAADKISIGPCGARLEDDTECPGTLHAIVGATTARCRECGGTMSVHERQAWAISEAWHVRAFLPDIVRWLAHSGHARIDEAKTKKWVQRGKLHPVACDMATRRHLFTPAAVIAAYRETPTGRKATIGQTHAA